MDRQVVDIDDEIDRRAQQVCQVTFEDGAVWRAEVSFNLAVGEGWKIGQVIGIDPEEAGRACFERRRRPRPRSM